MQTTQQSYHNTSPICKTKSPNLNVSKIEHAWNIAFPIVPSLEPPTESNQNPTHLKLNWNTATSPTKDKHSLLSPKQSLHLSRNPTHPCLQQPIQQTTTLQKTQIHPPYPIWSTLKSAHEYDAPYVRPHSQYHLSRTWIKQQYNS